ELMKRAINLYTISPPLVYIKDFIYKIQQLPTNCLWAFNLYLIAYNKLIRFSTISVHKKGMNFPIGLNIIISLLKIG
ncbi:MAG: hypothetical protein ACXACC_09730, partial [Promethearchaeota archaeon]